MDNKKRTEVRLLIDQFRDKPFTDEVLKSFCERKGIEFVSKGVLEDYIFEQDHAEKMQKLYPRVLEALKGLQYSPAFVPEEREKEIGKENDKVRETIIGIFEEFAIDYRMLEIETNNIGRLVSNIIEMAGNTLTNKAASVLAQLARERYGGSFSAKDANDYLVKKGEEGK